MKKSLCVFTTRKVVVEGFPIHKIVCDEDGDWQFFAEDDIVSSQNALLVSLEEILQIDSTLMPIVSLLSVGQMAYRKDVLSAWEIKNL